VALREKATDEKHAEHAAAHEELWDKMNHVRVSVAAPRCAASACSRVHGQP
jgi:hypothetical protein